jgi:hypothetical protein
MRTLRLVVVAVFGGSESRITSVINALSLVTTQAGGQGCCIVSDPAAYERVGRGECDRPLDLSVSGYFRLEVLTDVIPPGEKPAIAKGQAPIHEFIIRH